MRRARGSGQKALPFFVIFAKPKSLKMISVKRVYEVLKDLANKEQRGFISPSEFNTMAPIAQTAVFNKMWSEVLASESIRLSGRDGQRDLSKTNDVREELSMYLRNATQERQADLKYTYPSDFYKMSSAKTYGSVLMGVVTSVPIEIMYDPHRLDYMLRSTLSGPSIGKPVALVADKLEVHPNSIKKIDIRYYKSPEGMTTAGVATSSQPQYGFSLLLGNETFDSSSSINFELPEDREEQLVVELAGMIGTSLRDAALINYGRQQA